MTSTPLIAYRPARYYLEEERKASAAAGKYTRTYMTMHPTQARSCVPPPRRHPTLPLRHENVWCLLSSVSCLLCLCQYREALPRPTTAACTTPFFKFSPSAKKAGEAELRYTGRHLKCNASVVTELVQNLRVTPSRLACIALTSTYASHARPAPADPQQRRPQDGVAAVLSMHGRATAVPPAHVYRTYFTEAQGSSLSSQHLTYAPGTRTRT